MCQPADRSGPASDQTMVLAHHRCQVEALGHQISGGVEGNAMQCGWVWDGLQMSMHSRRVRPPRHGAGESRRTSRKSRYQARPADLMVTGTAVVRRPVKAWPGTPEIGTGAINRCESLAEPWASPLGEFKAGHGEWQASGLTPRKDGAIIQAECTACRAGHGNNLRSRHPRPGLRLQCKHAVAQEPGIRSGPLR